MARDGNDVLREEGPGALRRRLDQAKPQQVRPNGHDAPKLGGKPPLPLVRWSEIRVTTAVGYLVRGLIPIVGLIVVYGPPKCGKTFWLFDILMHVALGTSYRGRRVQQGTIVYCLFEGQAAFAARVEAFRQRHLTAGSTEPPFLLMPVRLELVRNHGRLVEAVRAQAGGRVAAVVLDTLNRSFTGSESSDEAMTAYVAACDAIRSALNCAVVIVHHSGLAEGRARGHTALLGSADAQIAVRRDAAQNVVAIVEYMKDGEAGAEIASRLEQVTVSVDDEGEPITSCVVVPAENAIVTERALTANQQTMLAILLDAGPNGLSVEDWHERAREIGIGSRRKADLFDIRRALLKRGLIRKGERGWFATR